MPLRALHKGARLRYDELSRLCNSNLFTLDFLIDGAMVIRPDGTVFGSGVTVLNLSQGTVNGGKKSAAASAAAQGDGKNKRTCGVAIKLSEDDCGTELAKGTGQKLMIFNGALRDGPGEGGKERVVDPRGPIQSGRGPLL